MKKLLFTLLLSSSFVFAQEPQIYKTEDGREISVTVLSNDHTGIQPLNIWAGGVGGAGKNAYVGATYYMPGKHLFGLQIGRGLGVEGSSYFKTWDKDYIATHSLDSKNDGEVTTIFVAKIPHKATNLFGAHYGVSMFSELTDKYHNAVAVAGGLTYTRVKHGHWKMDSKYGSKRGSHFFSLHLDFLWYPKHIHSIDPNITIIPEGQAPMNSNEEWQSTVDADNAAKENTIGARFYVEGSRLLWSKKGRVGLKYFFGGGIPHSINGLDYYYILGGFGLSVGLL